MLLVLRCRVVTHVGRRRGGSVSAAAAEEAAAAVVSGGHRAAGGIRIWSSSWSGSRSRSSEAPDQAAAHDHHTRGHAHTAPGTGPGTTLFLADWACPHMSMHARSHVPAARPLVRARAGHKRGRGGPMVMDGIAWRWILDAAAGMHWPPPLKAHPLFLVHSSQAARCPRPGSCALRLVRVPPTAAQSYALAASSSEA
jgi:hypothetical protein